MEPLYSWHPWDKYKCPDSVIYMYMYMYVIISGANSYYKAQFGTFVSVLNTGVSSFQGVLNRGVYLFVYFLWNQNLYVFCTKWLNSKFLKMDAILWIEQWKYWFSQSQSYIVNISQYYLFLCWKHHYYSVFPKRGTTLWGKCSFSMALPHHLV